jgi:hypothetical protein
MKLGFSPYENRTMFANELLRRIFGLWRGVSEKRKCVIRSIMICALSTNIIRVTKSRMKWT